MMSGNKEWDKLLRLLDQASESDGKEDLVSLDSDHSKIFNQVLRIWNTADKPLPPPDVEEAWAKVRDKAGIDSEAEHLPFPIETRNNHKTVLKKIFTSKLIYAAAALLFLIIISNILFRTFEQPARHIVRVENGETEELLLTDGTRVMLDAGSLFEYPEQFASHRRIVSLDGEGYFVVAPDAAKSFTVRANDAIITVKGTEFNVRAWRQDQKVTVAVAQGKVSIRSKEDDTDAAQVLISKNQVSILAKGKNPSPPRTSTIKDHLSWMQRRMYFKSTSLREVLSQLERWYNVVFLLPGIQADQIRITIFIEDKPLEEILDIICLITGLEYSRDSRRIIFSKQTEMNLLRGGVQ
jgi:ferric-dicitrate binding protein FerR (iron transport regulator)